MNYLLKEAKLSKSGSEVNISCEFVEGYPKSSCVFIYHKYNENLLTVMEYNHTTVFPVLVTVDCSGSDRCTFALFGKNGVDGIEVEPIILINEDTSQIYSAIVRYCHQYYLARPIVSPLLP